LTEITKFYDCFGQEIEGQTCEYCQQTKPVKVFATSGVETNPFAHDGLMRQVTIDNKLLWVCSECLEEMNSKTTNNNKLV
jgi:hypothetical protein